MVDNEPRQNHFMSLSDQSSGKALFRLDGKVCLITGGAGHLGSAMTTALAEAGGHVCILGRTQGTLAALAKSLTDRGLSAEAVTSDVTMAEDIKSLIADLKKRHGRLDVLINNAYAGRPGVMANSRAADYVSAIEIAVAAPAELVNAAHGLLRNAMEHNGDASVINISSMYGMVSPDPRVYGQSGMNNPPHTALRRLPSCNTRATRPCTWRRRESGSMPSAPEPFRRKPRSSAIPPLPPP